MAKEWSPFDWDEDLQQPRGTDGWAGCAAILGIAASVLGLRASGAALPMAIAGGVVLGMALQWTFMLIIYPFVVAVVRAIWFRFRGQR